MKLLEGRVGVEENPADSSQLGALLSLSQSACINHRQSNPDLAALFKNDPDSELFLLVHKPLEIVTSTTMLAPSPNGSHSTDKRIYTSKPRVSLTSLRSQKPLVSTLTVKGVCRSRPLPVKSWWFPPLIFSTT